MSDIKMILNALKMLTILKSGSYQDSVTEKT